MPTVYRPTERHGKRVIYRSTDPKEPKRERTKSVAIFAVTSIVILIATAIAVWMK